LNLIFALKDPAAVEELERRVGPAHSKRENGQYIDLVYKGLNEARLLNTIKLSFRVSGILAITIKFPKGLKLV
jgi:hypothetical protein